MRFLKYLLWVLLVAVATVSVIGIIAPKKYHVERSKFIASQKEVVWEQVHLWRNFQHWSPWKFKDSMISSRIEGKDGEEGAAYHWESKKEGNGSMTNVRFSANQFQEYALYLKDWDTRANGKIAIKDTTGGVNVQWSMDGEMGFAMAAMIYMMGGMEKLVSADYELGLELLKEYCEKNKPAAESAAAFSEKDVKSGNYKGGMFAVIPVSMEMSAFLNLNDDWYAEKTAEIMKVLLAQKIKSTGVMHALYTSWDEAGNKVEMSVAIPIAKKIKESDKVKFQQIKAGSMLYIDMKGDYSQSKDAHAAIDKAMGKASLDLINPVIEQYIVGPKDKVKPEKYQTKIIYLVKPRKLEEVNN